MPIGKSLSKQNGYALLGALVLILVIGYALGEAGATWSEARRREKEIELLKIGDKFRTAIARYYNNTPGNIKQYPLTLTALLRDDRFATPQRYLRSIYADPLTGNTDWGMLISPSGTIMGVYSLSSHRPYKSKNFRPMYKEFEMKKSYSEWIFAYVPLAQ